MRYRLIFCGLLLAGCLAGLAYCRADPARLADSQKLARINELYAAYRNDFPGIAEISAGQAVRLAHSGRAVFIDLREASERSLSLIPGALSREEYLASPEKYADQMKIAYCTIGYRSGKFAQSPQGQGVFNLQGGILAWLHAGGELDGAKAERTRKVNVFGRKWNLAPAGYETGW